MSNSICSVCLTKDNFSVSELIKTPPGPLADIFGNYKVYTCKECGFAELNPKPTNIRLDLYYEFIYGNPRKTPLVDKEHPHILFQFDYIKEEINFDKIKNVLDFGPKDGCLVRYIKTMYPNVRISVVEKSIILRKLLAEENPRLVSGLFKDIGQDGLDHKINRPNLIIASHSLEHVTDINTTLKRFCDIGVGSFFLFLEVPDCDPKHKLNKLGHPHISFFTPHSFRLLLKRYNFEIIKFGVELDFCTSKTIIDSKKRVLMALVKVG